MDIFWIGWIGGQVGGQVGGDGDGDGDGEDTYFARCVHCRLGSCGCHFEWRKSGVLCISLSN